MTSWILWISKHYPEHWGRALEHGYWDMLKERDIRAGDSVYFWQGGPRSRLLGRTTATEDARPLAPGEKGPWEDAATAPYARRFRFSHVSAEPRSRPKWGEVAAATGLTPAPISGIVRTRDPAAEAWLNGLFETERRPVDLHVNDQIQVQLEDLLHDARDRAERTIALRRGQGRFRSDLLAAYRGRCAISGYSTPEVLEAAHISPYLGEHTNKVSNGLLLRADLHTLFDLHLITVGEDLRVRVAPALRGSPYWEYDGQPLTSTEAEAHRPAANALRSHHELCDWYDAPSGTLF